MTADLTLLLFWAVAIAGMYAAGFIGDWWDRREKPNRYLQPWRDADREPGDLIEYRRAAERRQP